MWRGEKWPTASTMVSRHELRSRLREYSREPFGDVLHELLQVRPTRDRLAAWAERNPDRWAHAIEVFARLNGYTEKTEHTENVFLHLSKASDAQLHQMLTELDKQEAMLIDGKALPAPEQAPMDMQGDGGLEDAKHPEDAQRPGVQTAEPPQEDK
jgi:hypothetical protein